VLVVVWLVLVGVAAAGGTFPAEVEELLPHAVLWETTTFLLGELQQPTPGASRRATIGGVSLEEAAGFPLRFRIGQPVHLATADVNNDGYVDLVLTTFTMAGEKEVFRTRLWVLMGKKQGRVQPTFPSP